MPPKSKPSEDLQNLVLLLQEEAEEDLQLSPNINSPKMTGIISLKEYRPMGLGYP